MITDSKHPYTLTRRAPQDNATPTPNRQTRCKYCGTSTVHWRETSLGFRLFDSNGERHFCEAMRKQADARPKEPATATDKGKLIAALQDEFDRLTAAHGHDEFTRNEVDAIFQKAKANALMRFI